MIPGPLLRVRACGMYRIKVVNELNKWTNPTAIEDENVGGGAFLTHLKLHGMHIGAQSVRSDLTLTLTLILILTLTLTLKDGGNTTWGRVHTCFRGTL